MKVQTAETSMPRLTATPIKPDHRHHMHRLDAEIFEKDPRKMGLVRQR